MNRFEKVISAVEKHQVSGIEENKKSVDDFRADIDKWRIDYEDLNTKKLQEVHSALKVFNTEISKG